MKAGLTLGPGACLILPRAAAVRTVLDPGYPVGIPQYPTAFRQVRCFTLYGPLCIPPLSEGPLPGPADSARTNQPWVTLSSKVLQLWLCHH